MNIDFIKWKVGYAEGFEWFDGDIIDPNGEYHRPKRLHLDKIVDPLLTQRAIEGINSDHDLFIIQQSDFIRVFDYRLNNYKLRFSHKVSKSYVDPAKEKALEYIYEQETE